MNISRKQLLLFLIMLMSISLLKAKENFSYNILIFEDTYFFLEGNRSPRYLGTTNPIIILDKNIKEEQIKDSLFINLIGFEQYDTVRLCFQDTILIEKIFYEDQINKQPFIIRLQKIPHSPDLLLFQLNNGKIGQLNIHSEYNFAYLIKNKTANFLELRLSNLIPYIINQ